LFLTPGIFTTWGLKKAIKYDALSTTHIFFLVAVKTAGAWNQLAVELIQEPGRCIAAVTGDTQLFISLQRGNAIAFLSTFAALGVRILLKLNGHYASVLYHFHVIASYLSKVAYFNPPYLHLAPLMGMTTSNFAEIFGNRSLKLLGYHVMLFA